MFKRGYVCSHSLLASSRFTVGHAREPEERRSPRTVPGTCPYSQRRCRLCSGAAMHAAFMVHTGRACGLNIHFRRLFESNLHLVVFCRNSGGTSVLHAVWCGVEVHLSLLCPLFLASGFRYANIPFEPFLRPHLRHAPLQECAALQPAMLDFLQRKGRVLRKMGALTRAAEAVDSARMLDKADRYMNSKVRRKRTVLCASGRFVPWCCTVSRRKASTVW